MTKKTKPWIDVSDAPDWEIPENAIDAYELAKQRNISIADTATELINNWVLVGYNYFGEGAYVPKEKK